ncbi:PREDICTED: ubinuclein-1 isoform X2 [Trachymyrmex septentrionalis]|uniref:ubinuclein-1 isoform X2 n=1 Tax=Trachymyrmex septentrionalis TaxID=34720 RepID=UPI00084F6DE9|nr:PREDICTED: ubinuclein-1 isoform X2 [Trachymyrmex septentrionalis]
MSEAKRVPLQTLEFPEPLGHATKEKKGNMGKQLAPSFRFTLTLPESNEKTCPEFNYAQLLKSAEKKRRKEQKRGDENATNGLDPFDDDDDEDKLKDMARRFEAKYGTSTMGKKRHKYDDYVDLGAGYDENDSFIDNTDAYDEIVPEEMTTAHGGFYINCGALEFRAADRRSLVHNNNNNNTNNNNNNNNSDDEESSESSEEDTEDVDSPNPKRVDKRIISSSDDDETEDITGDNPRKRRKIEENSEKKGNHENSKKRKKPQNHQAQDAQQQNSQPDLDLLRRKEKNETTDAEGGTASEDQEEKKKFDKSEKNKINEKKFDIKKFEKKSSNSNGYDAKKIDLKRLDAKDSNIDDAIESVVNAAARGIEDDSSRDTTDSGKSRVCLYVESDGEEMENKEASLPENLPEDIREIVNKLKVQAENSKDGGKSKFFNSAVNEVLFNLEKKLRMMNSPSIRLQTYVHLVRFLPCSKITLLSRAKKLYLKDAEHRVNEPMQKLKTLIDNIMPSVMDKYMKECQKVADEKGFEGSPADAESSDEEDGSSKNTEKPKIPRKRFPWTDEAKKLVLEIANARRHYFKILRSRKESMESFVASFMDSNVLPLWPPGYVRLQTLLKYASPVEPAIKKKLKKSKEMVNANNVTTSTNTQVCNVAKNDATNVNNLLSQENERTNMNVSKVQIIGENSTNFASQATAKSNDVNTDRKQHSNKYKDMHTENNAGQQQESATVNNFTVGKISVVPTAQLMAQKPTKSHVEKFNFMDLTNSSLSITRVDYDKLSTKITEAIKDRVSITPCPEPVSHSKTNEISQTGHHSVYRQDTSYSSAQALKHRFLQENADVKCEKRLDDKDVDATVMKTEKKEKKRERCVEVKHKSSHDQKKRKKDHKMIEQQIGPINQDVVPMPQQTTLSKEEQEQRQNEETIAATNFLSQIINDDSSPRGLTDKRKDGFITDDTLANAVQPTDQEKDVQMVMRSLKELQELQEMKYSPNNSPVGGTIQKPGKSNAQYVTYQEDYQRLYLKKEDKIRSKEEAQW